MLWKKAASKWKPKSLWFEECMILSNLSLILSCTQQTDQVFQMFANETNCWVEFFKYWKKEDAFCIIIQFILQKTAKL